MRKLLFVFALLLCVPAVSEAGDRVIVQSFGGRAVVVQAAPVVLFQRQAVVVQAAPVVVRQRAVVVQQRAVVVRQGVFGLRTVIIR